MSDFSTRRITESLKLKKSASPTGFLDSGTTLSSRYLVMDPLGTGGMGSVYRARDLRFPNVQKLVAIKVLLNQSPDQRHREMITRNFEREANILATLNHPAIPKIFDFFSEHDRSYLVQELIEGHDLENLMGKNQDPVPESQALTWAIELCDVLNYLHNYKPEPIVFRDMKPSNVMIDNHGRVRLIDFGIARGFLVDQKGTIIGTEGYSPPEQYRGQATPVGDIYALGATLHHLLTRRDPRLEPPFSFGDRPIRQINAKVSADFESVVNRALAYDANERFPSAQAMREALLRVQQGSSPQPIAPRPGTTGLLTGRIAGMGPSSGSNAQLPAGASNTVSLSSFLESGGIIPVWSFACEDEIRSNPTVAGNKVYVAAYDNNVYCLTVDGQFVWKFAAEGGFATSPTVADDRVFIGSEDGTFYAIDAQSGNKVWEYITEGPIRCTATVASGVAFFGSDDGHIYAINARSGKQVWRLRLGSPIRSRPAIAEKEAMLYFGSELEEFYAFDFSGQQKWSFRGKRGFTAGAIVADGLVYAPSKDNHMYALDYKNGWPVWRYRANKPIMSTPALDERQRLFFGCADKNVYALEGNSGKLLWRYETEDQVASSPTVYNERVYIGSADKHLYCLDTKRGKLEWKFKTNGQVISSPVLSNEMVLFGSTDTSLYALSI